MLIRKGLKNSLQGSSEYLVTLTLKIFESAIAFFLAKMALIFFKKRIVFKKCQFQKYSGGPAPREIDWKDRGEMRGELEDWQEMMIKDKKKTAQEKANKGVYKTS